MSLQFILGRAGSGKSYFSLNAIRQELQNPAINKNLILLVPEQATFQNELELCTTPALGGIIDAQVLSFRRLAWRVLQEVGGGARVHLGDLGKAMVIRHFIEKRKDQLQIFSGACRQPGFIESLAGAISEFKLYCISVEDIAQILLEKGGEDSLLASKLSDLQLIYQDLEEYLAGRFLDPDDYLTLLAQKLSMASFLQDAEIWIDGFTGFTPQELEVISGLLTTCQRVNITLTLDKESEFLNLTRNTYHKISQIALKNGVKIEKPRILNESPPYRFRNSKVLSYLEKSFFAIEQEPFIGETPELKIICGQNHRAEVEAVAREIRRLCREENYRYKDIAVILRDFAHYDLIIETVFSDYQIPFFLDRKRTVLHHPLIELVRSALDIVTEEWSYQAVFRYLKTDLASLSREEVDILENYVLAYGIRGRKWYDPKPWQYGKSLVDINKIRKKVVKDLEPFYKKVINARKSTDIVRALFELLQDLCVPEKLEIWVDEANQEGRLETAREHNQIWDGVVDILEQVVETMGEEEIELESFIKIINAGLESLRLGLIPPGLDQVVIGSLERSRSPNIKGAFVLGVSDGVIPQKPISEGLFNDWEREFLREMGLELAPSTKEKIYDEEFLIYTALTRAGKYLVLSYPLADSEGRALRPSMVIRRVKELFPMVKEYFVGLEPPGDIEGDLEFISFPPKALAFLGTKLRQAKEGQAVEPIWWDVYHWLLTNHTEKRSLLKVINGLFHTNQVEPIDPLLARKLFTNPFRVSVSRLEKFQACPFSHFGTYGLRLKERQVFKLTQPDLGQFFHGALEQLARKLEDKNLDWAKVDKGQVLTISSEIVEDLIPQIQSEILLSSARYRYLTKKFKKTVQRAALVLMEHARRGKFRPVGLEIAFGPDGQLPALKLVLEDKTEMELVGRIDRVDAALRGDKYVLRVIDYKSGSAGLSLLEVFYGFKLQLLAYLDIVLTYAKELIDSEEAIPAGVLYFYLKDPLIASNGPLSDEVLESTILKELKMQGLILADVDVFNLADAETKDGWSPILPAGVNKEGTAFYKQSKVATLEQMEYLRNHTRKILKESGEQILAGDVSISPYQLKNLKACQHCSFQAVCHFDTQMEGNSYRTIKQIENEEIWETIGEAEKVGEHLHPLNKHG
ncbi:MAG: helicase-exonuclease AddAB subunit AddB [Peptococcales bacterium]